MYHNYSIGSLMSATPPVLKTDERTYSQFVEASAEHALFTV